MNFYICSPSYDDSSGGIVVLHKLAHIINKETCHNAFIVPMRRDRWRGGSVRRWLGDLYLNLKVRVSNLSYKINPYFQSPIVYSLPDEVKRDENTVVIYPEIVFGNPLGVSKVVRWFLHQPGHFTQEIFYGTGELYFKFNSMIRDFELYNSKLSASELKVIHYPLETYNQINLPREREGTCYMVRKGKHKSLLHDDDSICLDGLTHTEIATVFKRTQRFISYDDYTAYSIFAVLCGCESVVVPEPGVSLEEWYPKESDRYGISYGDSKEQLLWAKSTKDKVRAHVNNEHQRSIENVRNFIVECQDYFFSTPKVSKG